VVAFAHHGAERILNPGVLRQWRQEAGLSLEQACVLARLSYPYLRAIESGARPNPSIHLLTRLAAVYQRDIGELFTPAGA